MRRCSSFIRVYLIRVESNALLALLDVANATGRSKGAHCLPLDCGDSSPLSLVAERLCFRCKKRESGDESPHSKFISSLLSHRVRRRCAGLPNPLADALLALRRSQ